MKTLIPPWDFGDVRFECGLAETPEELEVAYRIRFNTFCKPVYPGDVPRFRAEDFPDGLEHGPEDKYAIHLLAEKVDAEGREFVGYFRLIPCEKGFYIEHEMFGGSSFQLPVEHDGEQVRPETTFEAGRWCGHPVRLPGTEDRVFVSMILVEAAMVLSKTMGRTHWVCGIDHDVATAWRLDGWRIDPLGPVVQYRDKLTEVAILPMGNYDKLCRRLLPARKSKVAR